MLREPTYTDCSGSNVHIAAGERTLPMSKVPFSSIKVSVCWVAAGKRTLPVVKSPFSSTAAGTAGMECIDTNAMDIEQ
ncbi:hypothetical protein [Bifidobacterium sp. ESL0704]|uniref:hypothetical protein n=1 Tax=Bifidobacterium sp. ESL0704 TaxID=2983219 RepID=UPI0023F9F2D1|nr:hypothetical protein [Bifidobacterium sp. ESL0704]WEV52703.1 hypothetical protein OZX64_07515 [Bifidobacterium sp. ESL0704]